MGRGEARSFIERGVRELAGERGAAGHAGEPDGLTRQSKGQIRTFSVRGAERFAEELRQQGRRVEIREVPGKPALRQVFAGPVPTEPAPGASVPTPTEPIPVEPGLRTPQALASSEGRPQVPARRTGLTRYQPDPDVAAMVKAEPTPTWGGALARAKERAITTQVNQFEPARRLTEALRKIGRAPKPGTAPHEVMELAKNATNGQQQAFAIEYRRVIEPVQKAKLGDALRDYLTYKQMDKRIRDLAARPDSDVTPEGRTADGGFVNPREFDAAKVATRIATLQATLGPERFARVEEAAQKVWALNRDLLDQAHRAGIVGDAAYEAITRRGDDYVPFQVLDYIADSGETRAGARPFSLRYQDYLRRMEGTERDVRNVLASTYDKAFRTIAVINRNRAGRAVTDLATALPDLITKVPGDQTKMPDGRDIVQVYEAGERVTYAVPAEIGRAMKFLDAQALSTLGKILSITKRPLQVGATGANLAFAVPNAFRDAKRAAVYAQWGIDSPRTAVTFVADWMRGLVESGKANVGGTPSDLYLRFLRSGAAFSTWQKGLTPEAFIKQAAGERTVVSRVNLPGWLLEGAQRVNSAIEEAPKIAMHLRGERAGAEPAEIAYEVANYGGSPNFARVGTVGAEMNLLLMFYNARLQGTAANVRRLKERPGRISARLATLMLLPMTVLWAWNQQFDDRTGIEEVSATDRQKYHVLLLDDTYTASDGTTRRKYLKIAKEETEQLLGALLDKGLDMLKGRDGQTPQRIVQDFLGNVSPVSFDIKGERREDVGRGVASGALAGANPVIRLPAEIMANYNARSQGRIVPRGLEEHALPEEQRRPTTSPTMIELSKRLRVSPIILEYAITSGTGGLGQTVMDVTDKALGQPAPPTRSEWETLQRQPILSRFVGASGNQQDREAEERFYRMLDRATKTKGSVEIAAKEGVQSPRAQALLNDPEARHLIGVAKSLDDIARALAEVRKSQVAVTHHKSKPLSQKMRDLTRIAAMRHKLMEAFRHIERGAP